VIEVPLITSKPSDSDLKVVDIFFGQVAISEEIVNGWGGLGSSCRKRLRPLFDDLSTDQLAILYLKMKGDPEIDLYMKVDSLYPGS